MGNQIVIVDPQTGKPQTVKPVSFAELGIQERADLEEWIKENTNILGSELLIITSEYDKFDKSDKRLDLLALDENGKIVVIELKRDAAHTLADLQAIRYAAFCSTLTFEAAVKLRAKFAKVSGDAARQEIQEFVEDPGFSTLDKKPRIILAAGGFDDQELTSCVLWLRDFGVDIRCVEITPYRLGDKGHLILVPRVIIPLPQAEAYIVSAEKKEAEQATETLAHTKILQGQFWGDFVRYCEEKGASHQLISVPSTESWYRIKLGFVGKDIVLKALTQPATLECQLSVDKYRSASIYQKLESQKSEIEAELNATLKWMRPSAEGKRGRIVQTRPADIESRENWREYFEWLMERTQAFYNAFLPRLQAIKHDSLDTD